jgi:hypothetical protein
VRLKAPASESGRYMNRMQRAFYGTVEN